MTALYAGVTLVAAMLCGFGFVLQQHAAQQVRQAKFLKLGLIAKLIHNRRWLLGLAAILPYARYRGKQAPEGSSIGNRLAFIARFFAVDVAEILVFWSTRAQLQKDAFARVPLRSGRR